MKEDRKSPQELQKHMLGTYGTLRRVLTWIAVLLPVVVVVAGWRQCERLWLGSSISHYYHVPHIAFFTTRDFFVGGLLAAAACLYSYKGFSTRENLALNAAAIFAFFVAVLPTAVDTSDEGIRSKLHGTAAVLFFLCIAYVSLRRSRDTLEFMADDDGRKAEYTRWYFLTGVAMVAAPIGAVVLSFALDPRSPLSRWTFLVETLGVWAFAAYWYIKTREMSASQAERLVADAEAERTLVAPSKSDIAIGRAMTPAAKPVEQVVPLNPTMRPASTLAPVGRLGVGVALALGVFLAFVVFRAGRDNSCQLQGGVTTASAAVGPVTGSPGVVPVP